MTNVGVGEAPVELQVARIHHEAGRVRADAVFAEVDADPQHDAGRLRLGLHGALDREGAFDGIDDAAELYQRAVPDQLDDPALVLRHSRIEDDLAVALQRRERPRFVGAHHAGIADHVRRKDGRKASIGLGFGHASIRIGDSSAAPAVGLDREFKRKPKGLGTPSARSGCAQQNPNRTRPQDRARLEREHSHPYQLRQADLSSRQCKPGEPHSACLAR